MFNIIYFYLLEQDGYLFTHGAKLTYDSEAVFNVGSVLNTMVVCEADLMCSGVYFDASEMKTTWTGLTTFERMRTTDSNAETNEIFGFKLSKYLARVVHIHV